jgi:hypothetical protein
LQEYVNLDNTRVEEYGTGKMNNIIFTWIKSFIESIFLLINIFVDAISIIYMLILILIKVPNFYYFLGVLWLFYVILYLYWKWLMQLFKIRRKAKELLVIWDWKKIKVLMSKFEILQNQKVIHETDELWKISDELNKLRWMW